MTGPLHIADVREPSGPYWRAYQAERARRDIIENPDLVPDWFLIKLMQERLIAAAGELANLGVPLTNSEHASVLNVRAALDLLAGFIDYGHRSDPVTGPATPTGSTGSSERSSATTPMRSRSCAPR